MTASRVDRSGADALRSSQSFVPLAKPSPVEHRDGTRRAPSPAKGVRLLWPTTMSERRKVLRLWRRIAMVILQAEGKVLRLPAVLPDVMIWKDGEVWASNWLLAQEAGGCNERTIQREVEFFRRRGLLYVTYGWKRNQGGQLAKTRLMKLAIPADYQGPIPDLEHPDHLDTCGPHGEPDQADHGCHDGHDTCGPITVEQNDSAEANHAA